MKSVRKPVSSENHEEAQIQDELKRLKRLKNNKDINIQTTNQV